MCLGVMILIIELSRRNLKFAFVYRAFKKTGPCFISLYLWQFITVWTGNTLMVCCKLSLLPKHINVTSNTTRIILS